MVWNRRTGRTTRAIERAPKNAIYIWPVHGTLCYARDIARRLGRGDLQVVGLSWLDKHSYLGVRDLVVVVDHAVDYFLSREQVRVLQDLCYRGILVKS